MQAAGARVVGRDHPVLPELALEGEAPPVDVGLVEVVLEGADVRPASRQVELGGERVGEVDLLPDAVGVALVDAADERERRQLLERGADVEQRRVLVEDPEPPAQRGLAVPGGPHEPQARAERLPARVLVERAHRHVLVEEVDQVRDLVLLLRDGAGELVAQPQVEGQRPARAPVVLEIAGHEVLVQVAIGDVTARQHDLEAPRDGPEEVLHAAEIPDALAAPAAVADVVAIVRPLAAEAERVAARGQRVAFLQGVRPLPVGREVLAEADRVDAGDVDLAHQPAVRPEDQALAGEVEVGLREVPLGLGVAEAEVDLVDRPAGEDAGPFRGHEVLPARCPAQHAHVDEEPRGSLLALVEVVGGGQRVRRARRVVDLRDREVGVRMLVPRGRDEHGVAGALDDLVPLSGGREQVQDLGRGGVHRHHPSAGQAALAGGGAGHVGGGGGAQVLTEPLVAGEKEELVGLDGSADGRAELVVLQVRLGVAELLVEVVRRVQAVAAIELEERPVDGVGSRLGDGADDGPRRAPVLGRVVVGDDLDLLDGFGAHVRARGALGVARQVRVRHAVDQVEVLRAPRPRHRQLVPHPGEDGGTGRALDDARVEEQQLRQVAVDDRQVLHLPLVDQVRDRRRDRLHQRGVGRHHQLLLDRRHPQRQVHHRRAADHQRDALADRRPEARQARRHLVGADGQVRRLEAALDVREQRAGQAHLHVLHADLGAPHRLPRLVLDDAFDGPRRELRERGSLPEHRDEQQDPRDAKTSGRPHPDAREENARSHRPPPRLHRPARRAGLRSSSNAASHWPDL